MSCRYEVLITFLSCEVTDSSLLFIYYYGSYLLFSKFFKYKMFSQNVFCGSIETSLFVSRDTSKGKAAHIWISPDPTKTRLDWELLLFLYLFFM